MIDKIITTEFIILLSVICFGIIISAIPHESMKLFRKLVSIFIVLLSVSLISIVITVLFKVWSV